jgi:hypothetical protein
MTIEKNQKSNNHNLFAIVGIVLFFTVAAYAGFTEGFAAAEAYFK